MKSIFSLAGKRALITGSAQGIGNLLARGLAEHGASLVINDITQQRAEQAASTLTALGYDAVGYGFDVTHAAEVEKAIAHIEQEIGAIDILINNAGIQRRYPLTEFPEAEWDRVIDVNQKSVFLVSQQVAKYMMARREGKIINICSMQSELGRKTITPYAASKGAVKMLTRGMCVELAEYNIQVNGIAPGYYATDITLATRSNPETNQRVLDHIPANRWGDTQDLMGAAIFLASQASNYVNGHLLVVDGGYLVR